MLVLSRKTSSVSYGSGSFVFIRTLCILAARCFIIFPVTGDTPVRLTQLNQSLVWRYLLMFETLKALALSLSRRSVQWPWQLLWPGNYQLWSQHDNPGGCLPETGGRSHSGSRRYNHGCKSIICSLRERLLCNNPWACLQQLITRWLLIFHTLQHRNWSQT